MPQGFDYEFVDKLPDDFTCRICYLTLRKPVQTKCCGYRFCKECLDEANKSKAEPECPMDRKKLNLEVDLFPDKAAERSISSFLIKCPSKGCEWQGELGNFSAHEQKCDYLNIKCSNKQCEIVKRRMEMTNHLEHECNWRDVLCQHCKKTYKFRELKLHHLNECLAFPVSCPNSCGEVIKRKQEGDHISTVCPMTIVPCLYQKFGCKFKTRRKSIDKHLDSDVRKHLHITADHVTSVQIENATLKEELKALENEKTKLENEFKNAKTAKKETVIIEKEVSYLTQLQTEKSNEKTNYIFIWKIDNFQKSLNQAKEGNEYAKLKCDPFYTEKYGYKLQVSLYPNGNKSGKNTHVSVYLAVLKGEYDAILPWPLQGKIKFTLIDQKKELDKRKNIQHSFSTENNINFNRPETISNTTWGFPTFLSHELLKSEKYVVDDTIFLQVEVEM